MLKMLKAETLSDSSEVNNQCLAGINAVALFFT